jgi:hypothetical protein
LKFITLSQDEWVVCRVNKKKNSNSTNRGNQPAEMDPSSSYQPAESDPSSSYQPAVVDPSSSYEPAGIIPSTTYQPAKMDPSSLFDEEDIISLFANPNYHYANDIPASSFSTSSAMNMPNFSNFSGMTGLMTQSNQFLLPNNFSSSNQVRVNQPSVGNRRYEPYDNFRSIRDQGMAKNSIGAPMNNFKS